MLTEGNNKTPPKLNNSKEAFLSVLMVLFKLKWEQIFGRKTQGNMVLPEPFCAICMSHISRMASVCVGIRATGIKYKLFTN